MEFVRDFSKVDKDDVALAGGKGASLGDMTQAGFPVPPGFVVLSTAFKRFLEKTNLNLEIRSVLEGVNPKEVHTLARASEEIRSLILVREVPPSIARAVRESFAKLGAEYVAVRSSATAEDGATAAWAGQLETYLSVNETNLLESLKKCWASLYTPRAIFYRIEQRLDDADIAVAVVVQKMIDSDKSGIAFSVHPVTQNPNHAIIEAAHGLGEAIVSGELTPDSYVVDKRNFDIVRKDVNFQNKRLVRAASGGNVWLRLPPEIASAAVLEDYEIVRLARLITRLERHFSFPVDVEWAEERGEFYVTQSRPITTLGPLRAVESREVEFEQEFQREIPISGFNIWWRGHRAAHEFLFEDIGAAAKTFGLYESGVVKGFTPRGNISRLKEGVRAKDVTLLETALHDFEKKYGAFCEDRSLVCNVWFVDELARGFVLAFVLGDMEHLLRGRALDIRKKTEKLLPELIAELAKWAGGRSGWEAYTYRELIAGEELEADKLVHRAKCVVRDEVVRPLIEPGDTEKFFAKEGISIFFGSAAQKTLQGSTAYPGTARGRVRIVRRRDEMDSVAEGEILVVAMTSPDFLPAMQRAAAFVTDEGGVTCHAAIIARELKKPCVIGTKFATQVLKDGDLVEVDAGAGVVRMLKK